MRIPWNSSVTMGVVTMRCWLSSQPASLVVVTGAKVEPSVVAEGTMTSRYQFERTGYFVKDSDSTPERPVFNRTVTLRDSYAKMK